jgi:hypothetical protein
MVNSQVENLREAIGGYETESPQEHFLGDRFHILQIAQHAMVERTEADRFVEDFEGLAVLVLGPRISFIGRAAQGNRLRSVTSALGLAEFS